MSAKSAVRSLARILFSLLLLAAVVVLGQWPMGEATGEAVLRISLRTTRAKTEVCRDRSAAELEALPLHMREPRVCEAFAPPYLLTVSIDGSPLLEREVAPGGVKGDRPLIASEELALAPGIATVEVTWEPVTDAVAATAPAGPGPELPSFALTERVELIADRIALIELDESSGKLRLIGSTGAVPPPPDRAANSEGAS